MLEEHRRKTGPLQNCTNAVLFLPHSGCKTFSTRLATHLHVSGVEANGNTLNLGETLTTTRTEQKPKLGETLRRTTMFNFIKSFRNDEDGAVAVDWVVLTAAIAALGIAVLTSVGQGTTALSQKISSQLSAQSSAQTIAFN